MPWTVVEFPVAEDCGEIAAERLRAAGADGVAEEWRKGKNYLRGFWQDASENSVRAATDATLLLLQQSGLLKTIPEYQISYMEDEDWLTGWKQYFHPLEISPRLAVVPSWEEYTAAPGQQIITLDPGMAFGTGSHGTTYCCLSALVDYLQAGMRVCDVGTGSGILAIAAAKLGAVGILATDNDELAIRVAQENARQNEVAEEIDFQVANLLYDINDHFDLIIANILAPVIRQLIPQLSALLQPGGIFISSGYICKQEKEIRTALESAGHEILKSYHREDWVTLVSRRQA